MERREVMKRTQTLFLFLFLWGDVCMLHDFTLKDVDCSLPAKHTVD